MRAVLEIALGNAAMAAVLALLAAAVGRWCRRPALVHAVWLLVLVKLVTPPLRTLPLSGRSMNLAAARPMLRPIIEPVQLPARARPTVAPAPVVKAEVDRSIPPTAYWMPPTMRGAAGGATPQPPATVVLNAHRPAPAREVAKSAAIIAPRAALAPVAGAAPAAALVRLAPAIALVAWAAGSIWCAVTVVVRVRRFRALVRRGTPAPRALVAQVRGLADQLGLRSPACTMMPGEVCPMVYGLFGRNRLLIPEALWRRLSATQQASLLAHELAHLRRADHWVRALELVATVFYWWHPATWWARRELREAEEQCCDAWVARLLPGSASAYAAALLDAVEFMSAADTPLIPRTGAPAWASGLSEFQRLKRRLLMIKSPSRVSPKLTAPAWAAVLTLAGLSLPLSPTRAQVAGEKPPQAPQPPQATQAEQPRGRGAGPAAVDMDEARIIAGIRAQNAGAVPVPSPAARPGAPIAAGIAPVAPVAAGSPFVAQTTVAAGRTQVDFDANVPPGGAMPVPEALPSQPGERRSEAAAAKRNAQIQRAQADVKRLAAELDAATRRLVELETANARSVEQAGEAWKFDQDSKMRSAGIAGNAWNDADQQHTRNRDDFKAGTAMVNPPPGIGVHNGQYREVTIGPDGKAQVRTRDLPAGAGQPMAPSSAAAAGQQSSAREVELAKRLAALDQQLADLSRQVEALRNQMQPGTFGSSRPPTTPAPRTEAK